MKGPLWVVVVACVVGAAVLGVRCSDELAALLESDLLPEALCRIQCLKEKVRATTVLEFVCFLFRCC